MSSPKAPAIADAKPYPFVWQAQKPCLVIIDMQKDFVEPGGFGEALGNDVSPLKRIVPTLQKLLLVARKLKLPIVHTREAHKNDLSDCPPSKLHRGNSALKIGDHGPMGRILIDGEVGNDIVPELQPEPGEYNIAKPGKGAFYNTDLENILQAEQVSQLIMTGVTTEVCVQTTMREANDRGYDCVLLEDGTESYFPAFKQTTLDMIVAQGGIVGWTATTESLIQSLEVMYG